MAQPSVAQLYVVPGEFTTRPKERPGCLVTLRRVDGESYPRVVRIQYPLGKLAHFDGPHGAERLVSASYPSEPRRGVQHFAGERGKEVLVRQEWPSGREMLFHGAKGQERVVRQVWRNHPDKPVRFFVGETGKERFVRDEWPDGRVTFFEGARGQERPVHSKDTNTGIISFYEGANLAIARVVRVAFPSGEVQWFEGGKGEERLVRALTPSNDTHTFEGPKDHERLVRIRSANGTETHYEGEKGAEAERRWVFPSGNVTYLLGPPGQERKVRSELLTGEVRYYAGERRCERLTHSCHPASESLDGVGWTAFYTGAKGSERQVREVMTDGRVTHIVYVDGVSYAERTVHPDGSEERHDVPSAQAATPAAAREPARTARAEVHEASSLLFDVKHKLTDQEFVAISNSLKRTWDMI